MKLSPYQVVLERHTSRKSLLLEQLAKRTNNRCLRRCHWPKRVFRVALEANKKEIATALEQIYSDLKVARVNTISMQGKKRRLRGQLGRRSHWKKAIVTFAKGSFR